jgi:hypothetical protein
VKENVHAAVRDITDEMFWKRICIVLRAVFPALRLLRYCDKSVPAMDKMYYLSHRTTIALEKSVSDLNDESLFGDMTLDSNLDREMDIMGGDGDDDDDDNNDVVFSIDSDTDSDDSDDDDNVANATRPPKVIRSTFHLALGQAQASYRA